ncbi:MAG: hypothetical protein GXP08_05700 [Gammaproteobacteria bacterium]|nr:hypothetical protein [Gammaproteobacteria bacterium]
MPSIEFLPTLIQYTGNDTSNPAITPKKFVSLNYELRPETRYSGFGYTPGDVIDTFSGGYNLITRYRLTSIRTEFGDGVIDPYLLDSQITNGQAVREYSVFYSVPSFTYRSVVSGVQECGWDELDIRICTSVTRFDSYTTPTGFASQQPTNVPSQGNLGGGLAIDVNGDGASDLVQPIIEYIPNPDPDATPDIAVPYWQVVLGNPQTNADGSNAFKRISKTGFLNAENNIVNYRFVNAIDYNHDGLTDIILPNKHGDTPVMASVAANNWIVMQSTLDANGEFAGFTLVDTGVLTEFFGGGSKCS